MNLSKTKYFSLTLLCSKAIFRALFSCISPQLSVNKLKKGDEEKLVSIFRKWSRLLEKFSKNDGAQISVLSAVEDICVDHSEFTRLFCVCSHF